MKFNPHPYQEETLKLMDSCPTAALLLDPGMGKTGICLEDFRRKREEFLVSRALVLAPLTVCVNTWPEEIKKWGTFKRMKMHVAHGKKGLSLPLVNKADIVVTNPESLKWFLSNFKRIEPFDVVYIDESTMYKNQSSNRSKNLRKLTQKLQNKIPNRYILTGTPSPKGIADLYGQFLQLDPSILGGTLSEFRTRFKFKASRRPWGVVWEPTKDTEALILEAIKPYSIRLDAKDHLDMPDFVQTHRYVTLPQEAMAIYKALEKDLFHEVSSGMITAANGGVLSSKCRQVANGTVYLSEVGEISTEKTRKVEYIHQEKLKELGRLFDELGEKQLLVAYEYQHDRDLIRRMFKEKYGFNARYIGGGSSKADATEAIKAWNSGKTPALLINPASGAYGLNLQAGGHHICWYGMTWNLLFYIQLVARLWRQGQTEGVFAHHIIAKGTIDEVVWESYLERNESQIRLINQLKRRVL